MPRVSRRTVLRSLGVGAAGAAAATGYELASGPGARTTARPPGLRSGLHTARNPGPSLPSRRILDENARRGSDSWKIGASGTRPASDVAMEIKGYASKTSVHVGESIDFHASVAGGERFAVDVFRFGHYGGVGARLIASSTWLPGVRQPAPNLDPVAGTISCAWQPSWTLKVPASWISGLYLAVLTTTSGYRTYAPFVVRDDRPAKLLVVVPFTTYQAYNQFPLDGRLGKSLYYGYPPAGTGSVPPVAPPSAPPDGLTAPSAHDPTAIAYQHRARHVSFDRPYAMAGMPKHAGDDQAFVWWAEQHGYDVTYATSLDLHGGAVDFSRYVGVVFSGHDEYWSKPMRDRVTAAVTSGTSLAYMSANNVYWHIRVDAPTAAGEARSMHCYKTDPDPAPDTSGPTTLWRSMPSAPAHAEQGLLGVQYDGIVQTEVPLIVQHAEHWVWRGTGVRDGDAIPRVVGVEADGFNPAMPRPGGATQTLLSASPFTYTSTHQPKTQNTSVCEMPSGATVFVAGTMNWPLALGQPDRIDPRIQAATANVLTRMLGGST